MNKLFYLNQLLGEKGVLTQIDFKVLSELYKKSFLTPQDIAESIGSDVMDVIQSCTTMQNSALNLIELSHDKFLTTPETDELIEESAKLWAQNECPELLEPKGTRKRREISSSMEEFKDFALSYMEEKIDVKDTVVDRSNYLILFSKRVASVGALEIKNKGEVRVVGRKPTDAIIEKLASIGMKYRQTHAQTYFDIECTEENISNIIDALVQLA